jgi:hypothetical protein
MKPGDRRYTVEVLQSGQPRPYADHIRHMRVTFEWIPYTAEPSPDWALSPINNEQAVKDYLKGLCCGFTDFKLEQGNTSTEDHYKSRLDWLRLVSPGVWEFHVTTPFTD